MRPDSLYPEGVFWSDEMNLILKSLATKPVAEFGVGYKGTQLKASMFLGPERQRTSFKPMRCTVLPVYCTCTHVHMYACTVHVYLCSG